MSNQIVISSGAKVRSLEGVLTGTAGIVNSVPLGGANGVATLDALGKVPLSQLPASVVTYLGTWNAATNTPTLTNGVGDVGDLYICNVAGTVNFGAGPITFAVGDWVIYSGTEWQKSAGASGTVTSVAVTESGDALTITGSPITTSGTINIGFAGTGSQYIKGDGTLATFPTTIDQAKRLITEVYNSTGATLTKGTVVYINGGQGNLPTVTKAQANNDANSAQTYGVVQSDITNNNNGFVVVLGSLTDLDTSAYVVGTQLYLSGTTAGEWTSTKPSAPIHLVYVAIVVRSHPTQGVVEVRIQNGYELDELHDVAISAPVNNQGIFYNSSNDLWENKSIATALGYTPANDALVVKLAGTQTITGLKSFDAALNLKVGAGAGGTGYIGLGSITDNTLVVYNTTSGTTYSQSLAFPTGAGNTYTFPNASGTIALTSNITVTSITGTSPISVAAVGTAYAISIQQASSGQNGFLSSTDWNTFNNKQNALTNPVIGTGSTNYHAKFTGSTTIGNSMLTDDGTTLQSIGATRSNFHLRAASSSFYGQLAFTNGSNGNFGGISYNNANQWMQFETNTSEWMRLFANGNLRLFSSSSSDNGYKLQVEGDIFASSFVKSGGTSSQFLKADGSIDSNTYLTSASLSGYVTGSGTTSYVPRFTGTNSIGNGIIRDNGTTVGINIAPSGSYRLFVSGSVGTDLNYTATDGTRSVTIQSFGDYGAGSMPSLNVGTNHGLQFLTNNALRMLITAGGDLSINTTTTNTNTKVKIKASSEGSGIGLSSSTLSIVRAATDTFLSIGYYSTPDAFVLSTSYGADGAYKPIAFATSDTERLRITNGGYTKISNSGSYEYPSAAIHEIRQTAADWTLYATNPNASSPNGFYISYPAASPNGTANHFLIGADSTATRFQLRSNGGLANYQANNVNLSDERTKKDIIPLESYWDKFKAIEIVKFKYKDQTHDDYNIGVIAQQVEEVAPEFIDADGWDIPKLDEEGNEIISNEEPLKSVYTADLHHATIKVLQEAMAKIEQLEAKVSALENKS
jgi:creatinine amidohydrolase/Fe(II)-dependent formamide hydrolase-like protein